ncbi:MAG: vWA domain-containing protein, partial [Planctomycetota bacterium]
IITRRKLNLIVFFENPDTTAWRQPASTDLRPESWEDVFQVFSACLFESTDGQLELGRVRLSTCPSERKIADIVIQVADHSEASADLNGILGCGYIRMTEQHRNTSDRLIIDRAPAPLGQNAFIHEMGHYLFGLYDEYSGCRERDCNYLGLNVVKNPAYLYCTQTQDPTGTENGACVMDLGSGDRINRFRTEFCRDADPTTRTDHVHVTIVPGSPVTEEWVNLQHGETCMSCASVVPLATATWNPPIHIPPQEADFSGPTPVPTKWTGEGSTPGGDGSPGTQGTAGDPGPADITIVESSGRPGYVILIDRSASTGAGTPSKLELAKIAATNAIDLLLDGESLGVLAFGGQGDIDAAALPLPQGGTGEFAVVDDAVREAAVLFVEGLIAAGESDLVAGLEAARLLLQDAEVTGKGIVLLSDGDPGAGLLGAEAVDPLQDAQTRVFVASSAEDADVDSITALISFATRTCGKYLPLSEREADRGRTAPLLLVEGRGETVLKDTGLPVRLAPLGTAPDIPVAVPSYMDEVTFLVGNAPGSQYDIRIFDPTGTERTNAPGTESSTSTTGTQTFFRVLLGGAEDQDEWTIRVRNTAVGSSNTADFTFLAFGRTRTLFAEASIVAPSVDDNTNALRADPSTALIPGDGYVVYPDPIRVQMAVYAGGPAAGTTVTMRVRRPGEPEFDPEEIPLFDDGHPEHGDALANDGTYSALYSAYEPGGNGTYTFAIMAVNDGSAFMVAPNETVDPGILPFDLPTFTIENAVSAYVTGVPATFGPSTAQLLLSPNNPAGDSIPLSDLRNGVVMAFKLSALNENLDVTAITISSAGTGDESRFGNVSLYLDRDANGVIGNAFQPLAVTT